MQAAIRKIVHEQRHGAQHKTEADQILEQAKLMPGVYVSHYSNAWASLL
jgi:hypothetical protein